MSGEQTDFLTERLLSQARRGDRAAIGQLFDRYRGLVVSTAAATLGRALRGQGRPEEAVPAFRHALTAGPDSAEIQLELGETLDTLGRHAEAELAYRQGLVLEPGSVPAQTGPPTESATVLPPVSPKL